PEAPLHGFLPTGGPATAMHVPTLPACVQVSHCPAQSLSQHTPSTHWPVVHSGSRVHLVPGFSRALQSPVARSQKLPVPHCTSVAQPLHFEPMQTSGAQLVGVDA